MNNKIIYFLITAVLILSTTIPVMGFNSPAENNSSGKCPPIIPDAFHPPDLNDNICTESLSPGPGFYETSEYMIGSCAVSVIFLESNGVIDTNTEDWTSSEVNTVKGEIQQALNWWKNQNTNAGISFIYDWQPSVPTNYEPINRPSVFTDSSHEKLWVNDAMAYFGHTTGDWMYRTRTHNNAVRNSKGTDWAFTVYVVDSSNDADGYFSDGYPYCAWAYYGIFAVMTYDNGKISSGGWGISRMDQVMAHETGHIFWATDEYNGNTDLSGYLNAADIEGSGCIMFNNNLCLSSGTKLQVGWLDTDYDTIQDIVDTYPSTSLNPYTPDPTANTVLTYTGSATVSTYPNSNPQPSNSHNSVTINKISNVQYRIDSGSWLNAQASDGSFNSHTESFTFTTTTLSQGTHTIEARAINSVGNSDQSPSLDTITISSNSAPNTPSKPSGPTSGNVNTALSYTTSSTDSDGDQIKYGWDGNGDNVVDFWTNFYNSGATCTVQITFQSTGTYQLKVKSEDINGAQSGFSQALTVTITSGVNNPPNKPTINGPTSGKSGTRYTYEATATDPDGDKIYYYFDWDDGTNSGWVGPFNSGQKGTADNMWSKGTYSIKVKAKDEHGAESPWSDPLSISMPKYRSYQLFFNIIIEKYSNLLPVILKILEI